LLALLGAHHFLHVSRIRVNRKNVEVPKDEKGRREGIVRQRKLRYI